MQNIKECAMNERMAKLAKQCRMMHKEGTQYVEEFDKEKFAELIVKECARFIYNAERGGLALDLLEHFGVK